jgi:hypothetical protein
MALMSVDLPELGLPATATVIVFFSLRPATAERLPLIDSEL